MEKLRKRETFWRWAAIVTVIAFVLSFLAISSLGSKALGLLFLSGLATWISCIVYFAKYFPLTRNLRWLESKGMTGVTQDIDWENPMSAKSKIRCGSQALACTNPCVAIPYSEIAWIYLHKSTMYGAITVEQSTIICCKDGTKYNIAMTPEEGKWLLDRYIIPQSPQVVIGYGEEQKAQYLNRNPYAAQVKSKAKFTWGVVLLVIGAVETVACVVNRSVGLLGYLPALAMIAAGVILVMQGKRK